MRWIQKWTGDELTEKGIEALSQAIGMPAACARILAVRGIKTPEAVFQLLRTDLSLIPDPFLIRDMDRAAERLARAVIRREKITIFGDYDVDGITSTATLSLFLEQCGIRAQSILPRRMIEGYGLPISVVEEIAGSGCSLLITVDCGVTAVEEIALAQKLGMDVIVIDHHPPRVPLELPGAVAIVDPHVPNGCDGFDGKQLCAAGLAFLTCIALRKTLRTMGFYSSERREPRLREYMDLTALGTIADVVPLTGINRILVRNGLEELSRASRPGIWALKKISGLPPNGDMSAGLVSYRLAPKINAAGRLKEATPALDLLMTSDAGHANKLAGELEALNAERQTIEQRIYEEARLQADAQVMQNRQTIVAAGQGWHRGVVGIVASRLVEQFHRPAIVLAMEGESGTGSGRSPEGGIHLAEALDRCDSCLTRHGGHQRAAGLSLNAEFLEKFRQVFEEAAGVQTAAGLAAADPICKIDTDVSLEEVTEELAEAIKRLEPFGMGNPEPTLALRNIRASCKIIQAKRGGNGHLKVFIPGFRNLDVIGFNMGASAPLVSQTQVDLAFHLGTEVYQRQKKLSLRLVDIQKSEAPV